MKNYELMDQLSKLPAGANVFIDMTKDEEELEFLEENDGIKSFGITFEIQSTEERNNDEIHLDAW